MLIPSRTRYDQEFSQQTMNHHQIERQEILEWNKKQWEDPEEWKPERFLEDKYDPVDRFKTMSFGAGKRVCAGSLQAMLITCTSIGKLVQEFEWKLEEGEKDEVTTVGLTGRKLHPLQVIPKPRQ